MVHVVTNLVSFNSRGQVLLTLRQDHPIWCLPGGYLETGETLEGGMLREVHEEIGVEVAKLELIGIYSEANVDLVFPSKSNCIVACFKGRLNTDDLSAGDEVAQIAYFDPDALPENIVETHPKRIRDALLGQFVLT